jgi:diguanylate cyclase (GGDEF)-like protein
MIYFFLKGNKEIKIITFSFFIISIYWLYSTLIAHELVPWEEYPSDLAVFLCLLILAHSLIYKLNYTQELEKSNDELTVSSSTDYLTNLYNRKEIDTLLEKAINLNKRYKDNFSIILLDIDNFKETNDKYGHLVGDQVLISFANILVGFTREVDLIGRWGGEEFIIICPNTKKDEALILAEKLRATIEKYKFNDIGHKTASFGVVSYEEDESLNELLLRVDKALYSSKSKGRNKVTAN